MLASWYPGGLGRAIKGAARHIECASRGYERAPTVTAPVLIEDRNLRLIHLDSERVNAGGLVVRGALQKDSGLSECVSCLSHNTIPIVWT